ncbi:MAG TPA: hypothetical protein VJO35_14985 [Terriglobales bacterium]|nr:hypothetical protein [Terriglobales bacterium]
MKTALGILMLANAALFFFGAIQHVGVRLGPLHEPHILPAAIVEIICGISLTWGAAIVLGRPLLGWSAPLISNLIAAAGVCLGMVALAHGRGPRTASNDLYHHVMLSLIGVSLLLLVIAKTALRQT